MYNTYPYIACSQDQTRERGGCYSVLYGTKQGKMLLQNWLDSLKDMYQSMESVFFFFFFFFLAESIIRMG